MGAARCGMNDLFFRYIQEQTNQRIETNYSHVALKPAQTLRYLRKTGKKQTTPRN